MSRIFTEQWERRKWYLIRSLFDDIPILSPIPETQELSLNSPSLTEAREQPVRRPYSPLPDLIIEKEPNRHDDPEEYYEALERKVMKFYRKLFKDSEISSQFSEAKRDNGSLLTIDHESYTETELSRSDEQTNNSINQSVDQNAFILEAYQESSTSSSQNTSIETEDQSSDDRSNEVNKKKKSTELSSEVSTTSPEPENNEIIKTQALVHRAINEDIDNDTQDTLISSKENHSAEIQTQSEVSRAIALPRIVIADFEQQSDNEDQGEFEDLSISNNEQSGIPCLSDGEEQSLRTHCVSDVSSSPADPETMRRRQTSNDSISSINELDIEINLSQDFTTDKTLDVPTVREMEEAERSSQELSVILGANSTFRTVINKGEYNLLERERKRRLSEMSSNQIRSSPKQKKFENLALQTSFSTSDDESNWQEIQKRFFEGLPRIFKLCSCNNHDCC